MNCLLMNRPSLTSSSGRTTKLRSQWPQGCGTYQAAVMSGALALVGLPASTGDVAEQLVPTTVAAPVHTLPSAPGSPGPLGNADDGESDAMTPAGVSINVSGVSADTDIAPSR